jgi:hypothetical protein
VVIVYENIPSDGEVMAASRAVAVEKTVRTWELMYETKSAAETVSPVLQLREPVIEVLS